MGTPLYTDVRLYGEAGIPGVIYGAGPRTVLESHAKRADERLVLEDLRRATKVVARTLARPAPIGHVRIGPLTNGASAPFSFGAQLATRLLSHRSDRRLGVFLDACGRMFCIQFRVQSRRRMPVACRDRRRRPSSGAT